MRVKNRNISFFLFLAKMLKVIRIKFAFLLPTLQAKLILSILDCSYGKNLRVCGKVHFRPNGLSTIKLGNNVNLTARFLTNTVGTNPVMLECIGDGRIEIGNNSGVSSATISSRTLIKIGDYVMVGGNVKIFDHDFHSCNFLHRRKGGEDYKHVKSDPVIIEDDVFIGMNSIILKGVHIGARSIVGAGSVVTCLEIPPDSLVVGNPARIKEGRGRTDDMEE